MKPGDPGLIWAGQGRAELRKRPKITSILEDRPSRKDRQGGIQCQFL